MNFSSANLLRVATFLFAFWSLSQPGAKPRSVSILSSPLSWSFPLLVSLFVVSSHRYFSFISMSFFSFPSSFSFLDFIHFSLSSYLSFSNPSPRRFVAFPFLSLHFARVRVDRPLLLLPTVGIRSERRSGYCDTPVRTRTSHPKRSTS